MFVVYIVSCSDASFHVGITKDLNARIEYYNSKKNETPLRNRFPIQIEYQIEFHEIQNAIALKDNLSAMSDIELENYLKAAPISEKDHSRLKPKETQVIQTILPTSYLGNISYFSALTNTTELLIDMYDRYEKQTYRNRCTILSVNGLLNLSVPVTRPNGKNTLVKNVTINYEEDWQKDHMKTIESAYRSAPFYEYFASGLFKILKSKHIYLIDLNIELTRYLCQSLGLSIETKKANENESASISSKIALLPKERENYATEPYQQVFLKPSEFENNLSAIDWLFNCGKRF